jgi:hypothetical protein
MEGERSYENALCRTTFRYYDRLEDINAQREGDGRRVTKAVGCDGGNGQLTVALGIDHRPRFPPPPPSNL